jgi:hypothetical protein
MKKETHRLPSVIAYNLHTKECHVLESVELNDIELNEQVIKPYAKVIYEAMQKDIDSGKFELLEYAKAK